MFQHIVSVVAAFAVTFWATVVHQYEEVRFPEENQTHAETVLAVPAIEPPQTPFDVVLNEVVRPTPPTQEATTTPRLVPTTTPSVPFTPIPVPTPPPIIPTPTTPTPPVVVTPEPTPPITTQVESNLSAEALLKASIVNIICLPGGGLKGSSGTGVIIDPRGIILTVAHVGQQFILVNYPYEDAGKCYIRTGSPAKNAYTASVVYVSRSWLSENPTTFLEARPRGTGEHDFALLAISGSLTNSPLPSSFSYIPLAMRGTDVDINDRVGVGSYAAEFLTSSEVRSSLYPTISFAPVDDLYTFEQNTEDVISVLAGAAAQEGSSGGAVINADKELIGLISTRTVKPDLSMRQLQAISVDHIRRSFEEDMGTNFDRYLAQNTLVMLVINFQNIAVELLEDLTEAIEEARG